MDSLNQSAILVLPSGLAKSATVFRSSPSLSFRLSGESADGSGVVPQDESRPLLDTDEIEGEALEFNEV